MKSMTAMIGNRLGAAAVAAALAALLQGGEARAQASGGGPLSLFDNIFTGSPSKGGQTAPSAPRPGTSAQAQPAPAGSSAPLPWSGEDGAPGHPPQTASASRAAAANSGTCVAPMWPDAERRNISQ